MMVHARCSDGKTLVRGKFEFCRAGFTVSASFEAEDITHPWAPEVHRALNKTTHIQRGVEPRVLVVSFAPARTKYKVDPLVLVFESEEERDNVFEML